MNTIMWINRTLGRRRWLIILLCFIRSLQSLCGIAFALLLRQMVDNAVAGQMDVFWKYALALVGLSVLQIALYAINRYVEEDTKAVVENRLRQRVFDGILRREYGDMQSYHTGELMNRITSDVAIVMDGAVVLLPSVTAMVVQLIGALSVMTTIEPWIGLVFLAGGSLMLLLSVGPRKWHKRLHKRVQEKEGKVRSFLQEALGSLLVIHAFGCEDKVEAESDEKMADHRKIRQTRIKVSILFGTGLRTLTRGGYLFGVCWCGLGILRGEISYGTLTAVQQLIGQIQGPFSSMGGSLSKYNTMVASAERLIEIVEQDVQQQVTERVWTREEAYEQLQGISFDNVSFAYDADRKVLVNETFSVEKGEFAALIGSSGVGKSTIMKLLLSVYPPDEGTITVRLNDGTCGVKELPAGMFAYVPQGNFLMSGPIWKVVGFAEKSDKIDMDKVKEACRVACAEEFIDKLPKGYDTVLGERGMGLSEGQMQRIAVARAIYSGCPILLLDEATSALDADTERRMISSLKEMSDYTVFLITHRKEAWELCDRIIERRE